MILGRLNQLSRTTLITNNDYIGYRIHNKISQHVTFIKRYMNSNIPFVVL